MNTTLTRKIVAALLAFRASELKAALLAIVNIFRDEEIEALLEATGRIGPPLRSAVMRTLFGLIACTGLRISEALALLDADVDLSVGVLTVRCSKFGKSRQVPVHPSTLEALRRYRLRRDLAMLRGYAYLNGGQQQLAGHQPLTKI